MTSITWFGHSAFKVSDGNVSVLFDPFLTGNPSCPVHVADIGSVDCVCVTHDHGDHVGQAVEICTTTGAMLATVVGTAERLVSAGVPQEQVLIGIGFNMGGTVEHKGISITMVPAFHTTESGQPVGFMVRMPDGCTLYHAGDTCLFGDMALWGNICKPDVALLPIGDVFTMGATQAALACALLKVKKVVPMHWGTFPVLAQNSDVFKQALACAAPECQCLDIRPGQTIAL